MTRTCWPREGREGRAGARVCGEVVKEEAEGLEMVMFSVQFAISSTRSYLLDIVSMETKQSGSGATATGILI